MIIITVRYNVLVFMFNCKTLLLLLRWDTGKVRDRFDGMSRFKGWSRVDYYKGTLFKLLNFTLYFICPFKGKLFWAIQVSCIRYPHQYIITQLWPLNSNLTTL